MKISQVVGKALKAGAIGAGAAASAALATGVPVTKAAVGIVVTAVIAGFGHAAWNAAAQALGWTITPPAIQ